MKAFLLALAFAAQVIPPFLIRPTPESAASPATAHIWVDGSGTCVDNASPIEYDSATACATIDAAWTAADAGDTVRVKAGNYAEVPAASVDGSAGSPITFIADGAVNVCGVDFSGQSYLRFIGFVLDYTDAGCSSRNRIVVLSGTNTGLEFWNNTIKHGNEGIGMPSVSDRCNTCIFVGNTFTDINVPVLGGVAGIALNYQGDHSFFAYNNIGPVDSDAFAFNGTYNRWLNTYLHDISESSGGHSDFWQFGNHPLGLSFILMEANYQEGEQSADEHTTIIQNNNPSRCTGGVIAGCGPVTELLVRRNVVHNIGSGAWGMAVAVAGGQMTYFRMAHNTTVEASQAQTAGNGRGCCYFYNSDSVDRIYGRNDIYAEAWTPQLTTEARGPFQSEATNNDFDYNLSFDSDATPSWESAWTNQANEQTDVDPLFVAHDHVSDNFAIGSSSPAKDTGGALCVTSGSGTGTTFSVASGCGGWFRGSDAANLTQYSGALVPGDTITVGTDAVEIASISGDDITVTGSFTWANGESVFYGTDTTPDIGAYPYKAGGYSLSATYSCNGSTCTITPNDASLVRFVVCYENGVPYAVDNTSTYSCTDPSGTFQARVYPLYASTTLWAVATN